jgi:nitrilase
LPVSDTPYGKIGALICWEKKQIAYSQFDFDPVGHYARPDVFKLVVNKELGR